MIYSLDSLLEKAKTKRQISVAVAGAEDHNVLKAVVLAHQAGIICGYLIGNIEEITNLARDIKVDITGFTLIESISPEDKAKQAVSLILSKKANISMKGNIQTSAFLKAVLDKEQGLRTNRLISHIGIFQVSTNQKLLIITDAAMNIAPTLKEKVEIINNALVVAQALEIPNPKVAILAAVETVSDNMTATIDAAILTQMNRRGQIKGCIIDGPLALDGAISKEAATHKGITSEVAGEADILLVPDIEAGNLLYKSIIYLASGETAGIILGAKVPLILTSRADSLESKLYSIALSSLLYNGGDYAV